MKGLYGCITIFLILVTNLLASGQSNFRSNGTGGGNWTSNSTWEVETPNGSGVWAAASSTPTSGSQVVVVRSGDVVTVVSPITIDQTTVNAGATLNISSGVTLTVGAGTGDDLVIDGTLNNNQGTLSSSGTTARVVKINGTYNNNSGTNSGTSTARLVFGSTGTYVHNYTGSAGNVPIAGWDTNSTCIILSSNDETPGGLDQIFGNFIWNNETQTSELDLGGAPTSVGSFTVRNTGEGAILLGTAGANDLNVLRDFNMEGGVFAFSYTTSTQSTIVINGNLSMTGGQLVLTEAANVDITIIGNFSFTGGEVLDFGQGAGRATLRIRGNYTHSAGSFDKTGVGPRPQILFSGTSGVEQVISSTIAPSVAIEYTIALGAIVSIPFNTLEGEDNFLGGPGFFTLTGTLKVGSTHSGGALQNGTTLGNIRVPNANRDFQQGSTIVYNGTGPQYIGDGFPSGDGDVNLTIQNLSGVTLSDDLSIVALRTLSLLSGNLSIGAQTLTINGTVTGSGGIVGGPSSNVVIGGDGDFGTLTFAGTNELLNLSVDRGSSGVVTLGGDLTVLGQFTHSDGIIDFSGRTLTISGAFTNEGGVFTADNLATLVIRGSDAIVGDIPMTGEIGTFTLDHSAGATVSSISVSNRLNLLSGVLTGNVSFPVQSPTDVIESLLRRNGSLATPNALTASLYNVTYANTTNISTGEELVDGALNNITIAGSGTVTLSENLDVNGYFRLNSGTFNSGGKNLSIAGDYYKDGGNAVYAGSTITFDGTSTLQGSVALNFANVVVAPNSSLDLGAVSLNIAGNLTVNALGSMNGGSGTTTFNGNTTITIANPSTPPRFHNITVNDNATLAIACSDCGTPGNRPAIEFTGIWNSDKTGAVFTPAQNTTVRLTGTTNQNINIRETAPVHSFWNLEVGGSGNATLITTLRVLNDLTIKGTKLLSTGTGNETIYVGRHFVFDGGTFNPFLGTVIFNGSGVQSIRRSSGTYVPTFHNITLEQAGGTFAIETNVDLRNIFTISGNSSAVDFDGPTGNSVLTLLSTEAQTASIATIPNPAVVSGSITTQRFMSGNHGKIYRYISSPVTGAQVVDLQGEIPVTGVFTGTSWTAPTNCAGCMPCDGCVNNAQTMFSLNETITGKALNFRYEDFPINTNTETFQVGRGYAVYVREDVDPVTWNLRGTVTKGQQTLPVTYSGAGADDGWNLVGNPYPSTIDWFIADGTSSWTRTNVDPTIYLWDEEAQNFATYNRAVGAGGTGTFGGSRYIAAGQAFWVRTTAGSPSLIAREGIKANEPTREFLRMATSTETMRITLVANGRERDQAVIVANVPGATDNYDPSLDSYKFYGPVNLYTFTEDQKAMAINAMGGMGCSKEIAMGFSGATTGAYAIRFSEFDGFTEEADLYLIDKYTGSSFAIAENPVYEFQVSDDSASFDINRFSLLFSKTPIDTKLTTQTQDVCVGTDARIDILASQRDISYYAAIDGTTISDEVVGTGGEISLTISQNKISAGENIVMIMAKPAGCSPIPMENSVKVKVESMPSVSKVEDGLSCNGGSASLKAFGAPADGYYNWYETADATQPVFGQNSETFNIPALNKTKTYFVSITNALGCESGRVEVKAEANIFDEAEITVVDDKLVSSYASGNQWFIDGEKIDGATAAEYKPVETGVYRLDVTIGACVSSTEVNYVVTSTEDPNAVGVDIYPNPATDKIQIRVASSNEVSVSIYNSLGVKVVSAMTLQNSGSNTRTGEIDLGAHMSGFYLIEVRDGENVKWKKILRK